MAAMAGMLRHYEARSQVLFLVSYAGAGPKHLGHPPLHSRATAESWPEERQPGQNPAPRPGLEPCVPALQGGELAY